MTFKLRRRFFAWLLLSVFVPMTIAVALHTHEGGSENGSACQECLHHIHHPSHLGAPTPDISHCMLCQLHSLPFTIPTVVEWTAWTPVLVSAIAVLLLQIVSKRQNAQTTRAPPSFCFYIH